MTTTDDSTFDSSTVPVGTRPTAKIPIGDHEYDLQAPKLRVWVGMTDLQDRFDAGTAVKPHLQHVLALLMDAKPQDAESDELVSKLQVLQGVYAETPRTLQFAEALLTFLCECITDGKQAKQLRQEYEDNNGSVDIPQLRFAIDDVEKAFEWWLTEQSNTIGVARPELPPVPNRADRRAAEKKPAAAKKTAARTTASTGGRRATVAAGTR